MHKKKIFAIAISLILAVSLCLVGCGDNAHPPETTAESEIDYSKYPEIDYMSLDYSKYLTIGQYKGLNIEISPKPVITDADVAEKIAADLLYSGYTEKITDRAVTKNDTVSISFKGYHNGVAFAGGTGSKDNFTIYNGGGFIDGFADGLIGAMPGVEVDVNVTFPEKYHNEELAGKPAVFKVTVHHIYVAKELTDEIANSLTKGEHTTAASMTEYYKNRMVEESDREYKEYRADLVWSRIFKGLSNVNIPNEMIDNLYGYQLYWAKFYADSYNMTLDAFLAQNGNSRESIWEESKNNILTNMVIYSIMKTENITLSESEYYKFIIESGKSETDWLKEYSKEELVDMFLYTKTFYAVADWQSFTEKEAG